MRKMFMAILALAAGSSLFMSAPVSAQSGAMDGVEQAMIPDLRAVSRAARLKTAIDPGDPDTVWIGHIYDATYTAGGKMTAGGYGPYHVGRGPNAVTRNAAAPYAGTSGDNGVWDFDRFQADEKDSLQGWWPLARCFQSGAATFGDFARPWQGLDYGNNVNYVINQGAPKRTFGVVGLWHSDKGNAAYVPSDTVAGHNAQKPAWSGTEVGGVGSTRSAWCGMRASGDVSAIDLTANGGTGNAFNGDLLQYQGNNGFSQVGSVAVNGTDHNFPGYCSQLDQMLYRDIALPNRTDGLVINYSFSTNMSRGKDGTTQTRIGWFQFDPVSKAANGAGLAAVATADGNFISGVGAGAPCDSFMVYIGAPVRDGLDGRPNGPVVFTGDLDVNGVPVTTVYDKKRRWFSEVLRCTSTNPTLGADNHYKLLASYSGHTDPTNVSVDVRALYNTALNDILDADGNATNGGTVRLVFRVKTNRGFDDENAGNPSSAHDSGTRGAAIVDNVVVSVDGTQWAAAEGNFENETGTGAINNDVDVSALNAWKSTGKPPAVYFHVHNVASLAFNDPCGGLNNANRQCNLLGNIVTGGDHDVPSDKEGGVFGSNTQDRQRWFASPTINLASTANGTYNAMGIDDEIARTSGDYNLLYSFWDGGAINGATETGNFVSIGWQCYPARQINGNICWGETRHTTSIFSYGAPRGCFETFIPGGAAKTNSLIRTTNANNRPDSLRVYLHRIQRCYTFTPADAICSPTTGTNVGIYFDNMSVALIDAPEPPQLSIPIWMLIDDAFPANQDPGNVGTPATFDTCAAQIRNALNNAAVTGSPSRPIITGDSVVVTAAGASKRLDMIFRIKPGVGNYRTLGVRTSGLRKRPDGGSGAGNVVASGDNSFFGQYMANNGAFGSVPNGAHPGGQWSEHVWNSARCDTAEVNLFPTANNSNVVALAAGIYASMYHEDEPKLATLDATLYLIKNRCYMSDPNGATNSTNIVCGSVPPAYAGFIGAGATTIEYSKIIPDGLLTPGAHVEYFFRKSDAPAGSGQVDIGPDTMFVFGSVAGNVDGERWEAFSVLPDRWKDPAWAADIQDATAPACMLYLDLEKRRGDARFWVGIADTIGSTAGSYVGGFPSGRWGAHNGWHATGNQDITIAIATDPTIAVYKHGGQPGTVWDMFGVRASESSVTSGGFGSRLSTSPGGAQTGKKNLNGPSGDMLRNYYRILLILTGDLSAGNIGPYNDKGNNDIALLQDFANSAGGTSQPRGVWIQGRNFVEGQITSVAAGHPTFPTTYFGSGLVSGDYRSFAANTNDIPDLKTQGLNGGSNSPLHGPEQDGSYPTFGVLSSCVITDDVLSLSGAFGATGAAKYEDTGTGANPKLASIYSPNNPGAGHPMVTVVDGFRVQSLGSVSTLTSGGRMLYYAEVLTKAFGALCPNIALAPVVGVGDTPNGSGALVNFLALRSENPFRDDMAVISFGITRKEKVELKVYDVTGRLVKTLANREFEAGSHNLFWDGSNDNGQLVSRGVYFYQVRTPSFVSQKKMAVLKNN